ncbi:hypothetical protein SASPL_117199 [Salvia splendens]|uniref:Uncharacterized protein n=1 Tax=Salvia splendens TaxID=180675 RepID=A0A8X8XZ92_SALSN|nr:hypothetical protein SASPL_117199 [Salvia splendens]
MSFAFIPTIAPGSQVSVGLSKLCHRTPEAYLKTKFPVSRRTASLTYKDIIDLQITLELATRFRLPLLICSRQKQTIQVQTCPVWRFKSGFKTEIHLSDPLQTELHTINTRNNQYNEKAIANATYIKLSFKPQSQLSDFRFLITDYLIVFTVIMRR